MLPHECTAACREQLAALGWTVLRFREPGRAGAAQLIYLCPAHQQWWPEGWARRRGISTLDRARDPRGAIIWLLAVAEVPLDDIARALRISSAQALGDRDRIEERIQRRTHDAAEWIEPWARRLRAAGAIP